jgi:hypothetical protein
VSCASLEVIHGWHPLTDLTVDHYLGHFNRIEVYRTLPDLANSRDRVEEDSFWRCHGDQGEVRAWRSKMIGAEGLWRELAVFFNSG